MRDVMAACRKILCQSYFQKSDLKNLENQQNLSACRRRAFFLWARKRQKARFRHRTRPQLAERWLIGRARPEELGERGDLANVIQGLPTHCVNGQDIPCMVVWRLSHIGELEEHSPNNSRLESAFHRALTVGAIKRKLPSRL